MNPKITIITITYNSEKTLERAICSIINQKYDNIEYIIVDGGSNDGTIDIIHKYEKFISKWVSEPDDGISDAFNKGIAMASGDIIGIINSDDGLCENALNYIAESYDPDVDVYRGNIYIWDELRDKKVLEKPLMHFPFASFNMSASHQGTFVSARAYKEYGTFNMNYKFSMDYDLLMRFEKKGARFKYIDKALAYFTMGGITFTKFTDDRRKEMETILTSHGAKIWHIWGFRIVKYTKLFIKKILPLNVVISLKNKFLKSNLEK